MKMPDKITPRVALKIEHRGRRTIRGRIGFALVRLGVVTASKPITFRTVA